VLFLGRLARQKGPDRFLEAAALLLNERPDVRFVVAGAGELRSGLEHRARELGIASRVTFVGYLDPAAVGRALDGADVLVLPSRAEPFGLAALEALSHGVPSVVPNDAGVAEVAPSAVRVDCRDVEALADRVRGLLDDEPRRLRLAERGRAEASRQRWEDRAEELLDVYRDLVA
jgi:glycosyltransferase involved in cell wall biosynthesis